MFASDRIDRIYAILDNHIHVWSSNPSFALLAEILKNDRQVLAEKLIALPSGEFPKESNGSDAVRLLLLDYALKRVAGRISAGHFVMFRDVETVQIILEDSYGLGFEDESDDILIPHQNESLRILIHCLFRRFRTTDEKDVLCFLSFFDRNSSQQTDLDRTMRLRSMIWFIYLSIEIIKTDQTSCLKGSDYFKNKFKELLDRAIEGRIIDEDSRLSGFEGGRWDRTLFGWLQGEDRRSFVEKLRRQFNMENRVEHANRCLLADHRRCVIEQVLLAFCE